MIVDNSTLLLFALFALGFFGVCALFLMAEYAHIYQTPGDPMPGYVWIRWDGMWREVCNICEGNCGMCNEPIATDIPGRVIKYTLETGYAAPTTTVDPALIARCVRIRHQHN